MTTFPGMPVHTTTEQWIVTLVMIGCTFFLLLLVVLLFSNGSRTLLRAIGYYAQILFWKVFCLPCQCCWTTGSRWTNFVNRQMTRLDQDIQEADLGKTSGEFRGGGALADYQDTPLV